MGEMREILSSTKAEAAEAAQILHTSERFQAEGDGLKRLLSGAHFSKINDIDVFRHRTHY